MAASDIVASILAQWRAWSLDIASNKAPVVLGTLGGSSTNQSFLIGNDQQQWVLRVNKRQRPAAVNLQCEAIIQARVAELALCPALIYQHDDYSYCVRDYIAATPLNEVDLEVLDLPQLLAVLCRQIQRYQSLFSDSDVSLLDSYNYQSLLEQYADGQQRQQHEHAKMLALAGQIDADAQSRGLVLSHHDLTPGNILLRSALPPYDDLQLIDWEFARLSHPAMDFAMLAVELEIRAASLSAVTGIDAAILEHCEQLYRYVKALYQQQPDPA